MELTRTIGIEHVVEHSINQNTIFWWHPLFYITVLWIGIIFITIRIQRLSISMPIHFRIRILTLPGASYMMENRIFVNEPDPQHCYITVNLF
jgi:hypothetical protein